MSRPRIVLLRGHQANPWDLRPWEELTDRFDVVCLVTGSNLYDLGLLELEKVRVYARRDFLPRGRLGDLTVSVPGDGYLGLAKKLAGAAIVHSAELGPWFSRQPAVLKERLGYKLALTVWETIPFVNAYRTFRARAYRAATIAATDLFLPTTERARAGLLLEGVPAERIEVCPPGVDRERFSAAQRAGSRTDEHVVVSPGRLVWEKGHQDVIRALAALERGLVTSPSGDRVHAKLLIVGAGPEEERLRAYAADCGLA